MCRCLPAVGSFKNTVTAESKLFARQIMKLSKDRRCSTSSQQISLGRQSFKTIEITPSDENGNNLRVDLNETLPTKHTRWLSFLSLPSWRKNNLTTNKRPGEKSGAGDANRRSRQQLFQSSVWYVFYFILLLANGGKTQRRKRNPTDPFTRRFWTTYNPPISWFWGSKNVKRSVGKRRETSNFPKNRRWLDLIFCHSFGRKGDGRKGESALFLPFFFLFIK